MYNSHVVHITDSIQDLNIRQTFSWGSSKDGIAEDQDSIYLFDQICSILLCIGTFIYDAIKQFTTSDSWKK